MSSRKISVKAAVRAAKSEDKQARRVLVVNPVSSASIDTFQNFMAKVGIGTGSDNISSGGSYGFNPISRFRIMLEWMYRGSWVAGMAIDLKADDMTRAGVNLMGEIDPADARRMEEEVIALKVWQKINETIKWSRLYGGAIGVMLIDGQDPSTPFKVDRVGDRAFRGVLPLDRWQLEPSLNEVVDELGPDIGMPKYYKVSTNALAYRGKKIHYSRCLRLTSVTLPFNQAATENFWGLSELERLYDRLVAFDSATQGAAQLVYKAYIRTYSIEQLRDIIGGGSPKAMESLVKYVEMMRKFQSIEGITLLDAKDKFEGHSHTAFGGLSDVMMQFGQQISGALQIPLVRLFGQSPAGLNSTGESDLRMYYDGILQKQVADLQIPVTMMYRGVAKSLGITLPDGFGVQFKPLWQLTDKERADITQVSEQSIQSAYEASLISKPTALRELKQTSEVTGIFSNISDEEIQAAEDEPVPEASTELESESPEPGEPKDKKIAIDRKTRDQAASEFAWYHGIYIVIETPRGQLRRGKGWEALMPADYGYIRVVKGADGEQLDCFLGPNPQSELVWVIDQQVSPEGTFDEHKVMLGYDSQELAVSDYIVSHSNGGNLMGAVTQLSMPEFKNWLTTGNLRQPLSSLDVNSSKEIS
jgi:phage-related protein (TIGR01555 family)